MLDRFEAETAYEDELLQALQWYLEVLDLQWLCVSYFQKYMARQQLRTSTVCVYKKDFQLLQKVLKAHSTYYHEGAWLTRKYINSFTTALF